MSLKNNRILPLITLLILINPHPVWASTNAGSRSVNCDRSQASSVNLSQNYSTISRGKFDPSSKSLNRPKTPSFNLSPNPSPSRRGEFLHFLLPLQGRGVGGVRFSLSQHNENQTKLLLSQISASSINAYSTLPYPEIEIPNEFTDPRQIQSQLLAKIALNYAKIGQPNVAEQIFSKAISLAETIDAEDSKTSAWRDIAINLAKVGKLSDALKLVQSFNFSPNFNQSWLLGNIAVALAEDGQLSEGLQIAKKIPDTSRKNSALNQIAYQFTEAGKLSDALEVVKLLDSNSDALQGIADKYADIGKFAEALEIAQRIQDGGSKNRALANIATSYGKARKFSDGLQIAQKIEYEDLKNSALTNIAIDLAVAGRMADALQLIQVFDDYSKKIAVVDIAIKLAEIGQFSRDLPIDQTLTEDDEKGYVLAAVVTKLAAAGNFDDASKIAQTIEMKYFQVIALSGVSTYYERGKKRELAKNILKQGFQIAKTIENPQHQAEIFGIIAAKYMESGERELGKSILGQSLEIAHNIPDREQQESSLFLISSNLVEVGAVSEALQIANSFNDEVKQLAITQIVFKLIEIKEYSQALDLVSHPETEHLKREVMRKIGSDLLNSGDDRKFDRLLELAGTLENDIFKEWGLANIAVELAAAGERDRGLQIAQTLSNQEMKESALLKIAESYRKTGQNERVSGILTEVLELVESTLTITEISEKSAAKAERLGKIALQFAAAGEMAKSQELLTQVLGLIQPIPDSYQKGDLLGDIARDLGYNGQFTQALELAQNISREPQKSEVLAIIASTMAIESGQFEQALRVIATIPNDSRRGLIFSNIVLDAKKPEDCDRILPLVETITDNFAKNIALGAVASCFAQTGQTSRSLQIVETISEPDQKISALRDVAISLSQAENSQEALRIAQTIPDETTKISTLTQIGFSLAQMGEIDEALGVAKTISEPSGKADIFSIVAVKLAEKGQESQATSLFAQALELASTISDDYDKAYMLRRICFTLAEAKKFDQALKVAETISNPTLKDEVLSYTSIKLGESGDVKKAIEVVKTISDTSQKIWALTEISAQIVAGGETAQAESILTQIGNLLQGTPDDLVKFINLHNLAIAWVKIGNTDTAVELAQSMSFKSEKSDTLGGIAYELTLVGKLDGAMKVVEIINDDSGKFKALIQIAQALIENEQKEEAIKILDRAVAIANRI